MRDQGIKDSVLPSSSRRVLTILAASCIAAGAIMPFDGTIARAVSGLHLGGDLKREMEFVQQFGAITSCLLIAWVIYLLDPEMRRRLVRASLACIASAAGVFVLKSLIGRPRPRLEEPLRFMLPWTAYAFPSDSGNPVHPPTTAYAWEFWRKGISDLWSLPSAHTAAAFALACVLMRMYPPLKAVVLTVACIVGCCRVLLGAHYPSDVIIGGALGWCIAELVLSRALRERR